MQYCSDKAADDNVTILSPDNIPGSVIVTFTSCGEIHRFRCVNALPKACSISRRSRFSWLPLSAAHSTCCRLSSSGTSSARRPRPRSRCFFLPVLGYIVVNFLQGNCVTNRCVFVWARPLRRYRASCHSAQPRIWAMTQVEADCHLVTPMLSRTLTESTRS